jgi:hypothetical protein
MSHAPAFRGSHSSAPHNKCQGGKTKRPPDEEAEDHERTLLRDQFQRRAGDSSRSAKGSRIGW